MLISVFGMPLSSLEEGSSIRQEGLLRKVPKRCRAIKEKQLQAHPSPPTSSSAQSRPAITFQESALLREQNFGAGEGKKFSKKERDLSLEAHFAKGKFPALYTRQQCFPGGESLDAVAQRAEDAFRQLLEQHICANGNQNEVVAVVSHGIFLAELIAVIIKKDAEFRGDLDVKSLRGMRNTAWTKLDVKRRTASSTDPYTTALSVRVLGVNSHKHLTNLNRQGGGIGSSAYDPAQQDIRAFLGGGGSGGGGKTKTTSKPKLKPTGKPLRPKPY
ncbi:hypothetical protein D9619_007152 [Psilocybe cf. subviscida]|uniref:Uncharacterized protein n=1 Tax=Psilocybe cf. subviscida TaxID=2480587 RepID=A0A8H5B413_9AGAR|nr:hypothetical protein D9619_007152 [Psilocybe cf. subviscida]